MEAAATIVRLSSRHKPRLTERLRKSVDQPGARSKYRYMWISKKQSELAVKMPAFATNEQPQMWYLLNSKFLEQRQRFLSGGQCEAGLVLAKKDAPRCASAAELQTFLKQVSLRLSELPNVQPTDVWITLDQGLRASCHPELLQDALAARIAVQWVVDTVRAQSFPLQQQQTTPEPVLLNLRTLTEAHLVHCLDEGGSEFTEQCFIVASLFISAEFYQRDKIPAAKSALLQPIGNNDWLSFSQVLCAAVSKSIGRGCVAELVADTVSQLNRSGYYLTPQHAQVLFLEATRSVNYADKLKLCQALFENVSEFDSTFNTLRIAPREVDSLSANNERKWRGLQVELFASGCPRSVSEALNSMFSEFLRFVETPEQLDGVWSELLLRLGQSVSSDLCEKLIVVAASVLPPDDAHILSGYLSNFEHFNNSLSSGAIEQVIDYYARSKAPEAAIPWIKLLMKRFPQYIFSNSTILALRDGLLSLDLVEGAEFWNFIDMQWTYWLALERASFYELEDD